MKVCLKHPLKVIAYKETSEWYNEWLRMTASENEWQSMTTSDNKWQWVTKKKEWERIRVSKIEWFETKD